MAGLDIALDKAYLTAIWLETLFYGKAICPLFRLDMWLCSLRNPAGMNFVLYWNCLTMLTIRRRTPDVNKVLVGISTIMFAFSTAHVSLGYQRLIGGFIILREQPGANPAPRLIYPIPPSSPSTLTARRSRFLSY